MLPRYSSIVRFKKCLKLKIAHEGGVQQPCDYCGKDGASARCSKCKCYFYCNADCQKADWTNKTFCNDFTRKQKNTAEDDAQIQQIVAKFHESADEPCCVCYERKPTKFQLMLQCRHIFCITCINRQHQEGSNNVCPVCRAAMPRVLLEYLYHNASGLVHNAKEYLKESKSRGYYCTLAFTEYERFLYLKEITGKRLANGYILIFWP